MGVSVQELEDYIHNLEPVTFPHPIPAFPVSKHSVLQFPPPGSKDAEERRDYIPDYLPPIVSSQEGESPLAHHSFVIVLSGETLISGELEKGKEENGTPRKCSVNVSGTGGLFMQ